MTDRAFELILNAINKLPENNRIKAMQAFSLKKAAREGVAYVDITVLENRKDITAQQQK